MHKFKTILFRLLGILMLLIIGIMLFLWIKSPGTPDAVVDQNGNKIVGAISEIESIPVNGMDQYLVIRGAAANKPVLLMLHGGPGSPEFPIMKDANLILEKEFIVVHWEQRGAGKSYHDNIPIASMTIPQFVADGVEVTNHLRTRFKQDKIYLMGHSWGSFLGTLLAHQHPNLFHSYTGIGQVAHQYYGERLSYEWAKEQAQLANNTSDIKALAALTFPDSLADTKTWMDFIGIERNYVNKYGGGMQHENFNMMAIYKTFIFDTPEYTIQEKLNYLKGAAFSANHLWDDVIQTNFIESIDSIAIPVHILQGVHDYQTPFTPAKAFFDQLKAPQKTFYKFDHSAHTPFVDEPEKFNAIIKEKVLLRF